MNEKPLNRSFNKAGAEFAWLKEALGLTGDYTPFPWQEELLRRFMDGVIPPGLDIPTGLGKTGVMTIWLVARAKRASVPCRLVYVVDRRAVVDQATEEAERLRAWVRDRDDVKQALGLTRPLPISTLRGQHVDNREWLEDPATPAVITGTIDMIGSRLLFAGYGVSRKMRPYHAGLLGADTLVVLDEAHLVPPFEKLIEALSRDGEHLGPGDEELRPLVPKLRLVTLSATGRDRAGGSLGLDAEDLKHCVVKRRLQAPKRLRTQDLGQEEKLEDALAEQAWKLTAEGARAVRCLIFSNRRETAVATKKAIERLAKGDNRAGRSAVAVDTELFVGGRRVFERAGAAKRLKELGFIAGTKVELRRPTFLCATSAGEVGVDLDADHMVSDLVSWERMVQRLGRVNRRGDGDADVIVLIEPPSKDVEKAEQKQREAKNLTVTEAAVLEASRRRTAARAVLDRLPQLDDGARSLSLEALRQLRLQAENDEELRKLLDEATTPEPLRPALTRPLVDAWSMTSLKEHTGRPQVAPWLRGWIRDDPQTTVIWRRHLPARASGRETSDREIESFFEAAPPHMSEALETETFRVLDWLLTRAGHVSRAAAGLRASPSPSVAEGSGSAPLQPPDVAAIALSSAGDLLRVLKLRDLVPADGDKTALKNMREHLRSDLAGATLVVDVRMAGLADGLLDPKEGHTPQATDDGMPWLLDVTGTGSGPPPVRFRVRAVEGGPSLPSDPSWGERLRFATEFSADGEAVRWLVVEKWRHDAATEDDSSTGRPQRLDQHQECAENRARALANRLGLPKRYADMLAAAAGLHDEGKRSERWQRAFHAPRDARYAKTRGPLNLALLDGYRHEFGSLPLAAKDRRFSQLDEDLQDLALHLIAAHHGFARPAIATRGCEDAPPSQLESRAREVAFRFARLQKRWGPWGLAWWEALLRSADQQASRENDAADLRDPSKTQEVP